MHQLVSLGRISAAVMLLALAACAPKAPQTSGQFRTVGAPIWSNAQFDTARLVGDWRQSASFVAGPSACSAGAVQIRGDGAARGVTGQLCLSGQTLRLNGPLRATGPGRFQIGDQTWWVIWVDTDYRTLAIATPSGEFGFILNRGGALPPDRLRAAGEIFDFNGYDTRFLQPL